MLHRLFRLAAPALAASALTACTTLGLGTGAVLSAVDYLGDDLSAAILAVDLPQALAPTSGSAVVSFDIVVPGSGARHLRMALAPADASDVAADFPAPGAGRLYYFFELGEADRARMAEAQAWGRTLPRNVDGAEVALAFTSGFCARGAVDLDKADVSVLVRAPGTPRIQPLVDHVRVRTMLPVGAPLKPC